MILEYPVFDGFFLLLPFLDLFQFIVLTVRNAVNFKRVQPQSRVSNYRF